MLYFSQSGFFCSHLVLFTGTIWCARPEVPKLGSTDLWGSATQWNKLIFFNSLEKYIQWKKISHQFSITVVPMVLILLQECTMLYWIVPGIPVWRWWILFGRGPRLGSTMSGGPWCSQVWESALDNCSVMGCMPTLGAHHQIPFAKL